MLYVLNIANKFCQNNLDHGYSVSPFGWVTIQESDMDAVAIDILSNPRCGETGPTGVYWAYWGLLGLLGPTGAYWAYWGLLGPKKQIVLPNIPVCSPE